VAASILFKHLELILYTDQNTIVLCRMPLWLLEE